MAGRKPQLAPAAEPKANSAPPRAKPVPPKVRKEQQQAVAKLAERLWRAIAADDRHALARLLQPGSPAAALDRVYGPAGLTAILKMPYGEGPERFTMQVSGDEISGVLSGTAGTECRYYIYCRDGKAAELLPFRVINGGFYWWARRSEPNLGRLATRDGLDAVERLLATVGAVNCGLPVTARALVTWHRIAAQHERLLTGHASAVLAATLLRLVEYHAGGRATFAEVAVGFRVPEQDVRRADRAIRPLLALTPGQRW